MRAVHAVSAALVLAAAGCTASLPTDDVSTDPTRAAGATTRPSGAGAASASAVPSTTPAPSAATQLTDRTREPLGADVLPAGYAYVDSVDVDGSGLMSNIYGGPEGPTGPMLLLYTGIGPDYINAQQSDLDWADVEGFSAPMHVRVARAVSFGVPWTFVDVDIADVSVQLIGHGTPEAEVVATAERLLAGMPGAPLTDT